MLLPGCVMPRHSVFPIRPTTKTVNRIAHVEDCDSSTHEVSVISHVRQVVESGGTGARLQSTGQSLATAKKLRTPYTFYIQAIQCRNKYKCRYSDYILRALRCTP